MLTLAAVPILPLTNTSQAEEAVPHADASTHVVETVAAGLDHPWSVAILPDGRRLVTLRQGQLLSIAASGTRSWINLDGLPPIHREGTSGLMEIVLDPDFPGNGLVYLTMSHGETGANGTRLVRAKLAEDRLEDIRILFDSTPKASDGNNGGRVAFLRDHTLILTLGDGNVWREEAQNLSNHLGKLVRLDREGNPPSDNPFVGNPDAAPEILSLGHRNVQGVTVDPADGSLLISEHGPRGGDEINLIRPGGNYGWPIVTGGLDYSFAKVSPFQRLDGYESPVLEWTPSIAPAGLAIYDGALFPEWRGDLLVPALKERGVRRIKRENGRIIGQEILLADRDERMRDVKVAPDGSIHILTDGPNANLLRLTRPVPTQ
ncbi:aldose sugar dehydrogenase YliI [Skermanella stibiiresistens SB22]|uniref:Aldose sugar dehydrogenase YliI n=1 Tax=Skermanella stibiiresistens SB22 TaxID=1385369 RepID=W9H7A3_9PROT|nr:aldose sugar dehydrogenase YliI [Skermanella stibiiresistens SB22]